MMCTRSRRTRRSSTQYSEEAYLSLVQDSLPPPFHSFYFLKPTFPICTAGNVHEVFVKMEWKKRDGRESGSNTCTMFILDVHVWWEEGMDQKIICVKRERSVVRVNMRHSIFSPSVFWERFSLPLFCSRISASVSVPHTWRRGAELLQNKKRKRGSREKRQKE